jgi:cytochrome P450
VATEDPLHWDPYTHTWLVADRQAALRILGDPAFSSHPGRLVHPDLLPTSSRLGDLLSRQLLFLDPPEHTRLRALISHALSARRVRGLADEISTLARAACSVSGSAGLDAVSDVARPVPLAVVGRLLGLPPADHEALQLMSDAYTRVITGIDRTTDHETLAMVESFMDYALAIVRDKRWHPADDATTDLVAAADSVGGFDDLDLAANLVMLVASGHQTTSGLIAGAILSRLGPAGNRPTTPFNVEAALAELSPSRFIGRTATADVMIGGRLITAGQSVLVLLAAINRASLSPRTHLAFGHGPHRCPGALLARLEGRIVVQEVLTRWHDAELSQEPVRWSANINLPCPVSVQLVRGS